MITEYWLAAYLGRAWQGLHLIPKRLGGPEGCWLVARGHPLPAGRLMLAQMFASRAWTLTTALFGALFFGTAVGGSALPAGPLRVAGLYAVIIFLGLTAIAGTAMWLVIYRGSQTRHYVLRGGAPATREIATPRGGQPRARDFWIGLTAVAVCFGGMSYLMTRYH